MNTYFRILAYGRPWGIYIPQYLVYTLLYVMFSVFNLALLIPLLDVLFNQVNPEIVDQINRPEFSLNIEYVKDIFNYYFASVIADQGKIGALKYVCVIIIAASFFANVFRYLISVILAYVRANVLKNLRKDIYHNLTNLHIGYFTEKRKGDIVSRTTNDVSQLEYTVVNSLKALLREPLLIIGQFVLLFTISASLTLYTLLLIPISGFIIGTFTKRLKLKAIEGQASMGLITNMVEETLTGIRLIKAFTARNAMIRNFYEEIKKYARISVSISRKVDLAGPLSEFLGIVVVSTILLIGGISVLQNDDSITASQFITFIIVFARILQPAKEVANSYSLIQRGLASGERIFELIDAKPEIKDNPGATEAPVIQDSIAYKNVSFSYENNSLVLKNISFKIPKGKTVALVGPSGGGKSTLADLLPRFFDPDDGQVQLDGVDIKEYKMESLRKQMGIVTQESILFNDTIFNNIAFGIEDPSEDEVMHAAKIANAHGFIMETSEGYKTNIGEHGAKLSGGQKQRLSIARAVMKNPAILILDEATSALDSESEKLVQDALTKLMTQRTSLVIAHRLSTIQHADEIIVIEDGMISERGRHDDLMKKDGIYKKLSLIQKG